MMSRSTLQLFLCVLGMSTLSACAGSGHFSFLGYTTRPNYAPSIRTVRIPIFKNTTFYQGLEFELTQALRREIEQKTPLKVVDFNAVADTELTGTIVGFNQSILNRTQLNEKRDIETVLGVEIVWRDLRTGEVLSQPQKRPNPVVPPSLVPLSQDDLVATLPTPEPTAPVAQAPGVVIFSRAAFRPELGESITTARKRNVDLLALQIVQVMETPWLSGRQQRALQP